MLHNNSYFTLRSEQLSLEGRRQAELHITTVLRQLDPEKEIEGTVLSLYTPWACVEEIPPEHMETLTRSLVAEVRARKALGDEKYFANLRLSEKVELYQRALDMMKRDIKAGVLPGEKVTTFSEFQGLRDGFIIQASPWPKEKRSGFEKPTLEEVRAYCDEKKLITVDPAAFIDHYDSNGWLISGKTKMKDWKAAVRQWSRRKFGPGSNNLTNMGPARDPGKDVLQGEYKPMGKAGEKYEIAQA